MADYRWKATQRWKTGERLKILRDVVQGCCILDEFHIMHRDIRASNIFYSQNQRKYILGGFECARTLSKKEEEQEEEDLMTVNGI